jgi:ribonuclease VapC
VIIDRSAFIALALHEPGFEVFDKALVDATSRKMSAPTFVEIYIVLQARTGAEGILLWESMLHVSGIVIESFTEEHALIARQAFANYGTGRHPAGLNFGDCFSYALAKATGEPLLFKGDDFRKTDIVPAIS